MAKPDLAPMISMVKPAALLPVTLTLPLPSSACNAVLSFNCQAASLSDAASVTVALALL